MGLCADKYVVCVIHTRDDHAYVGDNSCLISQEKCPRLPGEDYTKCKSICKQEYHAEVAALNCAIEHGADLQGAMATVGGIKWCCRDCQEKLYSAGIEWIKVVNE